MKVTETISTNPIPTEKSVRAEEVRVLTSCRAGKIIPVSYIPLLREDRVSRGNIQLRFEMAETVHPLMNAVNVTAYVHFVPFLAFDRFSGMDAFNRSYQGINEPSTASPIPFFQQATFTTPWNNPILKTMGIHLQGGRRFNMAPIEAYLEIVNFRRKARTEKLSTVTDINSLAPAFWKNPNLYHIVPDFDAAMLDGAVDLSWTNAAIVPQGVTGSAKVQQLWRHAAAAGTGVNLTENVSTTGGSGLGDTNARYLATSASGVPVVNRADIMQGITFELQNSGIKLSLANIDLAKKTAAFAKLRGQFSGLSDDHLIDLLMEGIRVPDEALKQPILLDKKSTVFGYTERHATDGASLDKSVTTGQTVLDMQFRTPPMNTGGIIMVTVEIVPEQLFERMNDAFLDTVEPAALPNFMRDFLDPEKVAVVKNRHVDVKHSTPDGTFGYAPLNHEWKRSLTRIGGRYFRPETDTFIEDRQRFWSVEKTNPKLTEDFYVVGDLPHTVFADSLADPFEILALGNVQIVGNTVFGQTLEEDRGDYEDIMAQVETQRIVQ